MKVYKLCKEVEFGFDIIAKATCVSKCINLPDVFEVMLVKTHPSRRSPSGFNGMFYLQWNKTSICLYFFTKNSLPNKTNSFCY